MNTSIKLKKLGIALAVAGICSSSAYAADFSGTASVTVITPLSIAEDTAMSFGSIGVGPTGGTLSIDQADTLTAGGDINITGGTPLSGDFTITGEASQAYTISYTAGSLDIPVSAGNPMAINNIASNATGTIGVGGTEAIIVSADLIVAGSQPSGTYSTANDTPYTITINY